MPPGEPPGAALARQLSAAVWAGDFDRTAALLARGADPDAPFAEPEGLRVTTPRRDALQALAVARRSGDRAAASLVARGRRPSPAPPRRGRPGWEEAHPHGWE